MLGALRGGGQAAGAAGRRIPEIGLQPSTRLGTCSAGMRHKAELLAALAGEPPVLLLDEPFANLDVEAIGVLCGWLDGWRRDRVILISHHGEAPLRVDGEWRVGSGGAAGRDAG